MAQTRLDIDLADPADIRAKLPEAQRLYASKQRTLNELAREVENWRILINRLAALAGVSLEEAVPEGPPQAQVASGEKRGPVKAPAQEAAVRVVTTQGRPMRAAEVAEVIGGSRNAVNAALWAADRNGRLRKVGPGLYAPPDYEPDELAPTLNGGAPLDGAELTPSRGK